MESQFRVVQYDDEGHITCVEFYPDRPAAEAAAGDTGVVDEGYFDGFSFYPTTP